MMPALASVLANALDHGAAADAERNVVGRPGGGDAQDGADRPRGCHIAGHSVERMEFH